jgi:PAS domain-containing protein
VRMLANPVMLRALVVLIFALSSFLLAVLFIRKLRKSIAEESDLSDSPSRALEVLPLHVYNTVIQQLKQQKHELTVQSQAEQQRARASESFSQTVLANLSSGVLVFGANGLVKSSNPAGKAMLGFASPAGMSAEDIFRGAVVHSTRARLADNSSPDSLEPVALADEVHAVLREGSGQRQVEGEYETPSGERRFISMTVSPLPAADEGLLGVACLMTDRSEVESIRRQEELQGEISAEMALRLRTSLTTIAGYAQQLANNRDPEFAQQLAQDIAQEAVQLDRSIGGFLTTKRTAKMAATGGGTD